MIWSIDLIDDSNRTGSMEFVVSAADAEAFYPVEVRAQLRSTQRSAMTHPNTRVSGLFIVYNILSPRASCAQVSFSSNKIYCDVAVESIIHTQKNTPVKYSYKKFLQTGEYLVQ